MIKARREGERGKGEKERERERERERLCAACGKIIIISSPAHPINCY